eukprot:CFRG5487T1
MVGFGPQSGTLHLKVLEGKNLPAADRNGYSDPFVTVSVNNSPLEDAKSHVVKKSVNPVWNWEFETKIEDCTQLTIVVYDWDRIGSNDKLGEISLSCPLKELVEVDLWETLSTGKGSIHVIYRYIPEDFEGNELDPTAAAVLESVHRTTGTADDDGENNEMGGAGLLGGQQTRVVDGRPVDISRPHAPLFATKNDISLNPKVVGPKRLLKPLVFNLCSLFISYYLGTHGYGSMLALFMVVMAMALEEIWSVRAVKMISKDFEANFDETHYPQSETADWLNAIMKRVWHNFPRVAEKYISEQMVPQLDANKDLFMLSKLELEDFNFGKRAPELKDLRVIQDEPNEFVFDFDLDWDWDFEVKVKATKGVSMPLAVKDFLLHAKFRVFIHLTPDRPPYCSYAWLQMISKPKLDVAVIPLVEITAIPGLDSLMKSQILGIITNMMVLPARFELDFAQIMGVEVPLEDQLNPEIYQNILQAQMEKVTGKPVNACSSPNGKTKNGDKKRATKEKAKE